MRCVHLAIVSALLALAGCRREQAPSATAGTTPALAPAVGTNPPPAAATRTAVIIDARGTRLSNAPAILVPLGAAPSHGADAAYKRSGPNDLYLTPLAEGLRKELTAGRITSPLQVIADETTTFRVLVEALFTAGQVEIGELELCERSCSGRAFSFRVPRAGDFGPVDPAHPRLSLTALIVPGGVVVKAAGASIAPGCKENGPGVTIPRGATAHDVAALESCIRSLRARSPEHASEDRATLSANADTPFRDVMDVALALQGAKKDLFPKLSIGVPR